ncbi:MAG: hypothetical protein EZS28_008981 [Streblomastix strix]|uniref:Uncharacterized protein n=1 Tax=Streblomastix strix TaxID=222440 RepID=A0A5J4WKV4_9EUKA|nr:MAG: hypothetical protein EZS28_008981 [Streblomastix strix]
MFCGKKNEQSPVCSIVFRIINLVYLIVGVVLLVMGIYYAVTLGEMVSVAVGLIILGIVIGVVSIFGCCGASYESKNDDAFCGSLLFLTIFFVASLAAGVFLILIGFICITSPDLIQGTIKTKIDGYEDVVKKTGHTWDENLDSLIKNLNAIGAVAIALGLVVLIGWLFSLYLMGLTNFLKMSITFGSLILAVLGFFILVISAFLYWSNSAVSPGDASYLVVLAFVLGLLFLGIGLFGFIASCIFFKSQARVKFIIIIYGFILIGFIVILVIFGILSLVYAGKLSKDVADRIKWAKERQTIEDIGIGNKDIKHFMDLINEDEIEKVDEITKFPYGSVGGYIQDLRKSCDIDKILGIEVVDKDEKETEEEGEFTFLNSSCLDLFESVLNYSCSGDTASEQNRIALCTVLPYEERVVTDDDKTNTESNVVNYKVTNENRYPGDTDEQVENACKCIKITEIKQKAGRQGVESLVVVVGLASALFGAGVLDVAGICFFALVFLSCYVALASFILGCRKYKQPKRV